MEREEIMRWVLRWLFGPIFDIPPWYLEILFQGYPDPANPKPTEYAYPDVTALSADSWQSIINFGEMIKYIHHAIEWENVLFFAYPYFWDTVRNWPFKRFLMHPDPIHREFLRSGSMRVVLTIRPGFEKSFAMLYQTGDPTGDPTTAPPWGIPYVTIAEEMRNFAMTNYEGIPPANPDNNVRPLLYPEQRRAWDDMQKLIKIIEDYNTARHLSDPPYNTTWPNHTRRISNEIGVGTQTVRPSSMDAIHYGTKLIISSDTDPLQESVLVTATTGDSFTATFTNHHDPGVTFQIDPAVKMYPMTSEFNDHNHAAIKQFVGAEDLPFKDFWGHEYHYTSPGLNADYDLVCYGKDGIPDQDQTAEQRANRLNRNIASYAEGSLVGRWYEYTPTGALDVAIDMDLPTKPQPA
jgi:hypothetical protein